MTSDRELLELAAKAAGIPLSWGGPNRTSPRRSDTWELCDPLANDGDAFELLVILGLNIKMTPTDVFVGFDLEAPLAHESLANGAYAATRRAITRAAAEIGRRMG